LHFVSRYLMEVLLIVLNVILRRDFGPDIILRQLHNACVQRPVCVSTIIPGDDFSSACL